MTTPQPEQTVVDILNKLMGHDDGVEFGNGYHDECKAEIAEAATQIQQLMILERIQRTLDAFTQLKQARIEHTLSTPVGEWTREIDFIDQEMNKQITALQAQLSKEVDNDQNTYMTNMVKWNNHVMPPISIKTNAPIDKLRIQIEEILFAAQPPDNISAEQALAEILQLIAASNAQAELRGRDKAIWNIMSPKTEGLFDNGELFIKRKPIEDAIISMIGFEKYKALQKAVDTQLTAEASEGDV